MIESRREYSGVQRNYQKQGQMLREVPGRMTQLLREVKKIEDRAAVVTIHNKYGGGACRDALD